MGNGSTKYRQLTFGELCPILDPDTQYQGIKRPGSEIT